LQKAIIPDEKKLENATTKIAQDASNLHIALAQSNPGLLDLASNTRKVNDEAKGLDATALKFLQLSKSIDAVAKSTANMKRFGTPDVPAVPTVSEIVGSPTGLAAGGMVNQGALYNFLTGKYAKGSDVVPAMLGRREFVVREPMAEKYYSQLVAMNAGRFPVYKAGGGSVSNTNVGDIHFTIQGGKTSPAMAREVASHIRRGIQQGTLKL